MGARSAAGPGLAGLLAAERDAIATDAPQWGRLPRVTRLAAVLLAGCVALTLSGCFVLMKVPGIVDEMSDLSVSGVPYYRHEGQTKYQESYRITYFLDPDSKRRYRVMSVDGKTFDSGWENVAAELAAGASVWGTSWQGRSEADVRSTFGPPTTATDAGAVRTLWYMGRRDGAYGVIFREGRLWTAFRTNARELDELLAGKPPY
jgi:hypothetical protein